MSLILVKKSDGTQVHMTKEEFKLYRENLQKNPQNKTNQTVVQKTETKEKILLPKEENAQPISQSVVESSDEEEILWSELDKIKEEPVLKKADQNTSEESDLPMIPVESSLANTTPVKDIFVGETVNEEIKKEKPDLPMIPAESSLANTTPVKDIFLNKTSNKKTKNLVNENKKILKHSSNIFNNKPEQTKKNIELKKPVSKQTVKSENKINLDWEKEDNKSLLEEDTEEIKKYQGYTVLPASKTDLVEKILAELEFTIAEELLGRTRSLILSRIKDIRTDEQVLEYAMRKKEAGGLNLTTEQAEELIISIKKHLGLKSEIQKDNKVEESLEKKSLSEVVSETKSSLVKPKKIIGQKPVLHDVVLPKTEVSDSSNKIVEMRKKSVGPLDELRTFDLRDWRRLSSNPVKAGEELLEKFMVLKSESFLSFMQGVEAWRQSPLYSMYKDIIAVCISSQQKIKDYLFNQDKNNILSPEEFDQLVKVNKNLI